MQNLKKRYIIIMLFVFIVIFIIANIWFSSNFLCVKNYIFELEKATDNINIVVLSDLHNHQFGDGNQKLIEKVKKQNPDLILLVGDFLNEDTENAEVPCELIRALSKFAPVCFALGNHEVDHMQKNGVALQQEMEAAGAVVLEEEYVDLEIKGTSFRIGGMYGYAFGSNKKSGESEGAEIDSKQGVFLKEFQDTDRLKIMMSHRPDSFIFGDAASYWDIDLVVSGHNHGGQVVFPFLGGLWGGDQGWFPEYVHGMYEKDGMPIFITSGLGSYSQVLPRFNNPPEIAVITIKGEN